jgi:hypothetical protein
MWLYRPGSVQHRTVLSGGAKLSVGRLGTAMLAPAHPSSQDRFADSTRRSARRRRPSVLAGSGSRVGRAAEASGSADRLERDGRIRGAPCACQARFAEPLRCQALFAESLRCQALFAEPCASLRLEERGAPRHGFRRLAPLPSRAVPAWRCQFRA